MKLVMFLRILDGPSFLYLTLCITGTDLCAVCLPDVKIWMSFVKYVVWVCCTFVSFCMYIYFRNTNGVSAIRFIKSFARAFCFGSLSSATAAHISWQCHSVEGTARVINGISLLTCSLSIMSCFVIANSVLGI